MRKLWWLLRFGAALTLAAFVAMVVTTIMHQLSPTGEAPSYLTDFGAAAQAAWAQVLLSLGGLAQCADAKQCDVAKASWALVLVTLGAFLAAVVAALFAYEAYRLEIAKGLGLRLCRRPEHTTAPDVIMEIDDSGKPFLRNKKDDDASRGHRRDNAFLNLGRTPLMNVSVLFASSAKNAAPIKKTFDMALGLGPIPVKGEVHMVIFFPLDGPEIELEWRSATEQGRRLSFHRAPNYRDGERGLAVRSVSEKKVG